jgi:hypothetical protein
MDPEPDFQTLTSHYPKRVGEARLG